MEYDIIENKLGYMEISPKPSEETLQAYYNDQYFTYGTYSANYDEVELHNKFISSYEIEHITQFKNGRLLDIGCGEGFPLSYFFKKGWSVKGIDFSLDGIKSQNPELASKVTIGNVFSILDEMIEANKEKFDVIICSNVLEHVVDPLLFLEKFKRLLAPKGVCRIQVPNDFSFLQKFIVKKDLAHENFWVSPPAHLSYFNKKSLCETLENYGYVIEELLGDFPIDLFLLNPDSNYILDKAKGKNCHQARLWFEHLLTNNGIEDYIAFRRGCGQAGIGRNLIVYCKASS